MLRVGKPAYEACNAEELLWQTKGICTRVTTVPQKMPF